MQYVISRNRDYVDENGVNHSTCVFVHAYECLQEAMDDLYNYAHRMGADIKVDNENTMCGFCIWKIYAEIGGWCYRITEEYEDDPFSLLFEGE